MSDSYHRILLHKKRDAGLIQWLIKDRKGTEETNPTIRKKLYKLMRKELEK